MIAVVGGGLSGLALAHELVRRGKQVVVLEADTRPGGTIRSPVAEGFITETGPNGYLDKEPATRALVETLGLAGQVRPALPTVKRRFVYARGALRELPGSPPAFLKSDLVPFTAKLRAACEPFTRRAPAGEDESLASFGKRHLGAYLTAALVDAAQTGIYAGNHEKLSVAAAFPALAELDREHRSLILGSIKRKRSGKGGGFGPGAPLCTFEGGMERLVATLAERLGNHVRLGTCVEALTPRDGRWELKLSERGAASTLLAGDVALAVPAFVAADLLRPLDAELSAELSAIEYAAVAVVHLGFARAEVEPPLEGFGFLIPSNAQRRILGSIYISSIFPWRVPGDSVLLTCMVGGARHPERAALDEDALVALTREELAHVLGVKAAPRLAQVVRWPRAIPQYNVGHLARVERIDRRLSAVRGLHLTGNAFRGVGVNDCIRNAALLAARLAPERRPSRERLSAKSSREA